MPDEDAAAPSKHLRRFRHLPNIPEIPSEYPDYAPCCVREKLSATNSNRLAPKYTGDGWGNRFKPEMGKQPGMKYFVLHEAINAKLAP